FKKAAGLYTSNFLSALCTIVLVWAYFSFLGTEKFVLMYAIPVLIAASTGAFLTFIQHSHPGSYVFDKVGFDPVLSHVYSTFNIRFPAWMEFFWLDINVHTPHHVLPGIPWYFLKEANEVLKAEFCEVVNERDFSFKGLRASWNATELIKVKEGVYRIQ
ncbi:MAG: fatty acid desaturase, partial [Bdellovibrionales bacterium]|nr:fatty acid desaturase [Bdellovibrionales bacterium]